MPMFPTPSPSPSSPSQAKTSSSRPGNRREPSQLQRRAPPLKITPAKAGAWNAAIPLLSPLVTPPTAAVDQLPSPPKPPETEDAEAEKMPVFKKWQHPAAPFYYETAPFVRPFVPV
ncbi:PREDICTED: uncharacterized protein At4g14450, chloroplastic [Tarenaya hassleriana]|uniref:uncharacterized protein At4g14450, chloroplastic n=1 Tax=Tarenaya hassleriana TaxID=28532 RepID=UPI00053C7C28|nr:PREDICTED: uncharacterized protein At4g14450, chloroplastic [Tarenaya hassleriana]